MFSRILVKLIDQAIVPAISLLTVRIIGVVLVSGFYNIQFTINSHGIYFPETSDYLLVNSYSTLFMVVVLALGLLYILAKAFFFHDSHIAPETTAKMFALKLPAFIQNSFDLYSQGAVWLSYLYLVTFVSGLMGFFGLMYLWVFVVSLGATIFLTVFLIFDVEREITFEKKGFGDGDLSVPNDFEDIENSEDEDVMVNLGSIK